MHLDVTTSGTTRPDEPTVVIRDPLAQTRELLSMVDEAYKEGYAKGRADAVRGMVIEAVPPEPEGLSPGTLAAYLAVTVAAGAVGVAVAWLITTWLIAPS